MSIYECPAGWGGQPEDPCSNADGLITQDIEMIIHVSPHDCVRPAGHELPHVCACGSINDASGP